MHETGRSNPSSKAIAILSLMVGAVTMSRLIEDENLSQNVLDTAANEVRRIAGGKGDDGAYEACPHK